MKKTTAIEKAGRTAAVMLVVFPLISSATPEMGPSGDKDIAEFIEMDVSADSRMEGTKVSVIIRDGIAILSGRVATLDQAERAMERALATTGVRAVVNQIEISSETVIDKILAQRAMAALKDDKALGADRLNVSAEAGVVTILGEVSTWDEQEIAREAVSRVAGVKAIENRTEVLFENPRTDDQIQAQLAELIANDPLYDGLSLTVSVKEGIAKLNGEVGSKGEYDRLVRRSSVTGVFEVNADRLRVNSDLAMEAAADKHFTPEKTMETLEDAFAADRRVSPGEFRYSLENGVLTLDGSVSATAAKHAVESTARGVPGVLAVNNQINVVQGNLPVAANAPLVTPKR